MNSLRSDSQNPSLAGESLSSFSLWYTSSKRGFSQYSNFTEQTKISAVLLNLKMAKWSRLNPWIITCKPKMNQVKVRTYKLCWTFWTSNFPPLWMFLQKQWINIVPWSSIILNFLIVTHWFYYENNTLLPIHQIKAKHTMMELVAVDWLKSNKREDDLGGRPGSIIQVD